MRTETVEYKLFKFDELSEDARRKVLEKFIDINVDYDWWDACYEGFKEQLKEVGLECKSFYFSLDRDQFIEPVNLKFTDVAKFVNSIQTGVKKSILDVADLYLVGYGHRHVCYKIEAYKDIPNRCQRLNKTINSLIDRCNDKLRDILSCFLEQLRAEYDYLTSDEAIIETIECNEYEFLENGKLYG